MKVGDKLWYVPAGRLTGEEVTVTKVGRKWLHLDNWLRADGERVYGKHGEIRGRIWESEAAHQEHEAVGAAWMILRRDIMRGPSPDVTLERIAAARKLLGL